jgi:hypothetical protein
MPTGTFLVENMDGLTLADSPATEWGSFLESNGLEKWGRVTDISIRLFGLSHTFPDDLDFLFLGPDGRNLEFWSDAGGGADIVNADFTISDSGASLLPDTPALPIAAGTYKPSD